MVDISLINGKVTLISTKLYPRIAFYHFLKFWKKYTTLTLFLKGRLTKKRTETKYTKQNRANALLWNFFPHPAVGDIQLLFTISPLIILCMKLTKFFISCAFLWKLKRMMLNNVWWNRDLQRPKSWNWKIRFISWSNGQVSEKFYWKVSFIFILGQESVANMNKTYKNSK